MKQVYFATDVIPDLVENLSKKSELEIYMPGWQLFDTLDLTWVLNLKYVLSVFLQKPQLDFWLLFVSDENK